MAPTAGAGLLDKGSSTGGQSVIAAGVIVPRLETPPAAQVMSAEISERFFTLMASECFEFTNTPATIGQQSATVVQLKHVRLGFIERQNTYLGLPHQFGSGLHNNRSNVGPKEMREETASRIPALAP
jgi:hypothetical protein